MRDGAVSGSAGASELKQVIETIEGCYEFMLAFAGAGLPPGGPQGSHGPIFESLVRLKDALGRVPAVLREALPAETAQGDAAAWAQLLDAVERDARVARAAVQLALARPRIGSQLVDNLNAFIHLRALLTDLFVVDELLDQSGQAAPQPATIPSSDAGGGS